MPTLCELSAAELTRISASTLAHYDDGAEAFWEGTRDHDVSQNVAALLAHLDRAGPAADPRPRLRPRSRSAHASAPWATRPSGSTARRASSTWRARTPAARCWHQDFLALDLPPAASTASSPTRRSSTCPRRSCRACSRELHAALRRAACSSLEPARARQEGWQGERYGTYLSLTRGAAIWTAAGFVELEHYYRPRRRAARTAALARQRLAPPQPHPMRPNGGSA